jgi:hypothetical protein
MSAAPRLLVAGAGAPYGHGSSGGPDGAGRSAPPAWCCLRQGCHAAPGHIRNENQLILTGSQSGNDVMVMVLTCSAPTSALSVRSLQRRQISGTWFSSRRPQRATVRRARRIRPRSANYVSEANSAAVGEQIYLGRLFGYQDSPAMQQHRDAGR